MDENERQLDKIIKSDFIISCYLVIYLMKF